MPGASGGVQYAVHHQLIGLMLNMQLPSLLRHVLLLRCMLGALFISWALCMQLFKALPACKAS